MTNRASMTTATLHAIACLPAPSPAQVTPESDVKTEVRAAWDAYIEAFSAGRTEVIANDIYAAPSFQLGAAGASVRSSAADTRASFDATHERLALERYDHSETDRAEICVIQPGHRAVERALHPLSHRRQRADAGSVELSLRPARRPVAHSRHHGQPGRKAHRL